MQIRKTTLSDVDAAEKIYEEAKKFMRSAGNLTQWSKGSPNRESILTDISDGVSYVCEEDGDILAIFMFCVGDDATYGYIESGAWLDDEPYAVIHRIAVSDRARGKGVASFVFAKCFETFPNLKIDTHKDNVPMQNALLKAGFLRCGTIYLPDGESRIAYQKNK